MTTDGFMGRKVEERFFRSVARKKEDMENKDVVQDKVLPYLPAKVLIRFKSVSKEWEWWIKSPFLAYQQSNCFQKLSGFFTQCNLSNPTFLSLNYAEYGVPTPSLRFLPERIDLRSSSYGLLVSQGRGGNDSYYICNPTSEKWKELPQPSYYHGSESALVLAFEPSLCNLEAHYELVCAVPLVGQPVVCFEIYSPETNSWRYSSAICVELGEFSFMGDGFYIKGTAYWQTSTNKVLAFHLASEVYGILSLPDDCPPDGVFAKIRGELCYVGISHYLRDGCAIVVYYGVHLSLRQEIHLQLEGVPEGGALGYRLLSCFQDSVVMILIGSAIYSYSLRDEKIEVISRGVVHASADTKFMPYVNSLVNVA